jgi:hypothetical protein
LKKIPESKPGMYDNELSNHSDESHGFILDPAQTVIYDSFMKAYAELLSR